MYLTPHRIERQTGIAAVLVVLGMIVELLGLTLTNPTGLAFFLLVTGAVALLGVAWYLVSRLS